MSLELINAVRKLGIKPCGRKFVAMALADYADEEGCCYPSVATLARYTSQSERTVREHLIALEESCFLTRYRTRNNSGQLGQYRYQLNKMFSLTEKDVVRQDHTRIDAGRQELAANFATGEKPHKPPANFAAHIHQIPVSKDTGTTRGAQSPAKQLPDDFQIPGYWVEYAKKKGLTNDTISEEFEIFCNHWRQDKVARKDWNATWRNWVIRSKRYAQRSTATDQKLSDTSRRRSAWMDAVDE